MNTKGKRSERKKMSNTTGENSYNMKEGELVEIKGAVRMVVKEMTFKEYCQRHDDLGLEYDIDDAWENWQERGPLFEVIDENGQLRAMWNEKRSQ